MKRIAAILAIVFAIIFILSSPTSAQFEDCNYPLIAGKENLYSDEYAGKVVVTLSSSEDNQEVLRIEFVTYDGWVMNETHLYVGSTPPTTSAPGRFLYKHEFLDGSYDLYEINLTSDLKSAGTIYFAAHAALQLLSPDGDVIQDETAWAFGTPIRDTGTKAKNWAMYFKCIVTEVQDGGNDEQY